ncbi:hypothetical protein ZZ51_004093, partial [Salmonella enterica subsp. enterica]|nr:hypothetical protein [Salmonella enterica subsp. enterica]
HYVILLFYSFPLRCKKYNTLFLRTSLVQYSTNNHNSQNKTLEIDLFHYKTYNYNKKHNAN